MENNIFSDNHTTSGFKKLRWSPQHRDMAEKSLRHDLRKICARSSRCACVKADVVRKIAYVCAQFSSPFIDAFFPWRVFSSATRDFFYAPNWPEFSRENTWDSRRIILLFVEKVHFRSLMNFLPSVENSTRHLILMLKICDFFNNIWLFQNSENSLRNYFLIDSGSASSFRKIADEMTD